MRKALLHGKTLRLDLTVGQIMSLRGRKIPNIPTMNCNGGWFSKTYIIFGANLGQKMTQNSSGVAAFARWYFLEFFVGHKCNSSLFLNFIEKSRKIYWSHLCLFLRGNDFILFLACSTILQFFFTTAVNFFAW